MLPEELSPEVAALIRGRIESYEALRALLLLHAERAVQSAQSAAELSARLGLSGGSLHTALESLAGHRLLERTPSAGSAGGYRYASGDHDSVVAALAQAYSLQPLGILRLLAARSIERIRAEALRAFADAFVFHKDKK